MADGGTYDACVELLAIGVSAGAQDAQGNTTLHVAAKTGNAAAARALCEHGADLNARNKHNRTPKMVVRRQQSGRDITVVYLISRR